MEHPLNLKTPPDAIFAASDYLAYGAIQVAIKNGYKIPKDLGFVGFSNEEFSAQITPSISTIEQYSERLGSIAANLLIDQLAVEKRRKLCGSKNSHRSEVNCKAIVAEKIKMLA